MHWAHTPACSNVQHVSGGPWHTKLPTELMPHSLHCCGHAQRRGVGSMGAQDLEKAAAAFNMESDLHAAFLATPVHAQLSLRDEWKVYNATLGHLKACLPACVPACHRDWDHPRPPLGMSAHLWHDVANAMTVRPVCWGLRQAAASSYQNCLWCA